VMRLTLCGCADGSIALNSGQSFYDKLHIEKVSLCGLKFSLSGSLRREKV
jgi:hypothetical protein